MVAWYEVVTSVMIPGIKREVNSQTVSCLAALLDRY